MTSYNIDGHIIRKHDYFSEFRQPILVYNVEGISRMWRAVIHYWRSAENKRTAKDWGWAHLF